MRPFDETSAQPDAYRALLGQVNGNAGLLAEQVQQHVDEDGCMFTASGQHGHFLVDPIPRVIDGAEWDAVRSGLEQRVAALERFLEDIYGERRIVREGVLPERVVATAEHLDQRARDLHTRTWVTVAGLDLVRRPEGSFAVLEDNVRTPSGLGYMLATRRAVANHLAVPEGRLLRPIDGMAPVLLAALREAAPEGVADPHVVVLTDGPGNPAFWEHRTLAEGMGVDWARPGDLRLERGRVWHREQAVDVVYRRTNEDRLTGELEALLGEPLRAGRLAVANAFGTGVVDDKLVHAHVEDMVRFYLGEEPELPSVRTYDLAQKGVLEEVLDRLGELVVKPRAGFGGNGVVIGPLADRDTIARARQALREAPEEHVAQDVVALSEHPTVRDGALAPRHVDLRPFVICSPRRRHVVPGGLTRVAFGAGEMVVNSSQNGGAKDTWVLD